MILVPDLQTVVLRVPRTASSALRQAIKARYPQALDLYHHMEADGVPAGHETWRKVGVVRDPAARLWSWYKFCRQQVAHSVPLFEAARNHVGKPFETWLIEDTFVLPRDCPAGSIPWIWPMLHCLHPAPESRKSAWVTLRPDLGTEIWPFERVADLARDLGVTLQRLNATDASPPPPIGEAARDHLRRHHAWDLDVTGARL